VRVFAIFFGSLDRQREQSLTGFTQTVKGKRLTVRQAQIGFVPSLIDGVMPDLSFSLRGLCDLGVSAVTREFENIHRGGAENAKEAQRI
jgi:hypothetical protein